MVPITTTTIIVLRITARGTYYRVFAYLVTLLSFLWLLLLLLIVLLGLVSPHNFYSLLFCGSFMLLGRPRKQ